MQTAKSGQKAGGGKANKATARAAVRSVRNAIARDFADLAEPAIAA